MQFYDELADLYHLIYEDWSASVERQGCSLAELIRARWPAAVSVADVACGIGTQAIGLASAGFSVTASDVSSRALGRAQVEASRRRVSIETRPDDMRRLASHADGSADVVIACDNAVPHLLSNDEILAAFRQFHRVIRPDGGCVISVRDYARIERRDTNFVPYGVRKFGEGLVSLFQVWKFEGDQYQLNFFFVFDDGRTVTTRVFRARYYAVTIDVLMQLLESAGFADVQRIDDVLFQPIIIGTKKTAGVAPPASAALALR